MLSKAARSLQWKARVSFQHRRPQPKACAKAGEPPGACIRACCRPEPAHAGRADQGGDSPAAAIGRGNAAIRASARSPSVGPGADISPRPSPRPGLAMRASCRVPPTRGRRAPPWPGDDRMAAHHSPSTQASQTMPSRPTTGWLWRLSTQRRRSPPDSPRRQVLQRCFVASPPAAPATSPCRRESAAARRTTMALWNSPCRRHGHQGADLGSAAGLAGDRDIGRTPPNAAALSRPTVKPGLCTACRWLRCRPRRSGPVAEWAQAVITDEHQVPGGPGWSWSWPAVLADPASAAAGSRHGLRPRARGPDAQAQAALAGKRRHPSRTGRRVCRGPSRLGRLRAAGPRPGRAHSVQGSGGALGRCRRRCRRL